MSISLEDQVTSPAYREYVHYLRGKLVRAEAGLTAMNGRYERAKALFDRTQARRGITPDTDLVNYVDLKSTNPELRFWYSKVEHFQREVAAYATALTGLEAAHRMLGTDDNWMEGGTPPADD